MKKILAFVMWAFIVLSMFSLTTTEVPADLTSSAPIHEVSWTLGDPFPAISGFVIFPALPPSAQTSMSYVTHWYAGGICPSSLAPQKARAISVSIMVPPSMPRSEEFCYVVLSAFDSNGSYDQIGFSADYGTWGLAYSWTSGSPYPGEVQYHYNPNAMALSPGVTYTFHITTQDGVTRFAAYQGSNRVWFLDAPTGGDYLILSNYYAGGKRGLQPYDYTNYEEVWLTSTLEGAPSFDFYFYNNCWVSINGSSNPATWTSWYYSNEPILVPSSVAVAISGNSILVENPNASWHGAVPASLKCFPEPLNLLSKGKWMIGCAGLPYGFNTSDIDVSSIKLNGTIQVDSLANVTIRDYNNDTVPELMVKFNRTDVSEFILSKGIKYGNATLTIAGRLLDGTLFRGSSVIRVRMPGDFNSDGRVDVTDIAIASAAFGSYRGHPKWKPVADENEDDRIDVMDLAIVTKNYGKSYS